MIVKHTTHISDVRGVEEVAAAVAKEPKATSMGTPVHKVVLRA